MKENNQSEWKIFSYNVRFIRMRYNIPKKEMAKKLGIGIKSLDKIEDGEMPQRLSVEIFFRIRNIFGIQPKKQLEKYLTHEDLK